MAGSSHRRGPFRMRIVAAVLGASLAALVGGPALAAAPHPADLPDPFGPGPTDVTAFFNGTVRGIVAGAVLGDGSVRIRSMVRGADPSASYRVVGSGSACGDPVLNGVQLLGRTRLMGVFVSRTHAVGSLPDRPSLLASIRILRASGGQVACAEALSYEPGPTTAGPALAFGDLLVSSFTAAGGPRGLLVTTAPDSADPQLRWSLTGLSGISSFRIVGSTAPCGTAATPATQTFRSNLLSKTYGFTEVSGLSVEVQSLRIVAKSGTQLACTSRGRSVQPLF